MSDQIDPSSSTSRPAVTITSEEEELVAESGLSNGDGGGDVEMKPVTNGTSEHQGDGLGVGQADTNGDDQMQGDGVGRNNEEEEEEEKVINPNALPGDACETLYLQNLNERVQLPGTFFSPFPFPFQPLGSRCVLGVGCVRKCRDVEAGFSCLGTNQPNDQNRPLQYSEPFSMAIPPFQTYHQNRILALGPIQVHFTSSHFYSLD